MISIDDQNKGVFPDGHPRIVFIGTPDFAVPSLRGLVEYGHNVVAVVTQPDRPKGRGRKVAVSPIKKIAAEYGLEILQPEKIWAPQFCEAIRGKHPDLLIVVAFGRILTDELLGIPRWGAINIHASLLPKYRGAAPIHWAILDNESTTGLTAMRMDGGLDTGPILLQEKVDIGPNETAGQLHERLSDRSKNFLLKTLKGLGKGRLEERPQDEANATYAVKIDRKMSSVAWDQPAPSVSALIRALDPWPGAITTIEGKELKLFCSRVLVKERQGTVPGRITKQTKDALEVETGKGVIEIREFQIPGKKRLVAGDFLRGFPLEEGATFGK